MRFWGCLLLVALIEGALAGTTGPTSPTETTATADNRLVSVLRADQVWNAVTTTPDGRIFVGFPHLDGTAGTRVAQALPDGSMRPYPDAAWNDWTPGHDAGQAFVRPNAMRIGPDGNLWV